MLHDFSISYEDIKLIPLNAEDSLKYAHARNKGENGLKFFSQTSISDEEQLKWFENYLKDETAYMFSCYLGDTWVGCNCIYHINGSNAEHGRILVDRQFCPAGKGVGTKMIVAAAKLAFEKLGIKLIYAEIFDDNIASIKSHERAGFKLTNAFDDESGNTIRHYEMNGEDLIAVK